MAIGSWPWPKICIGPAETALGLDEGGYRILVNHGANAHQEVPRFHLHIFGGRRLGPMLSGGTAPRG
jgi:diadenosine tetraphosphate (Ap4A) HIT family hydrolase